MSLAAWIKARVFGTAKPASGAVAVEVEPAPQAPAERRAGPRRVLHVGNIANNAYGNAKLLNEAGWTNHVAHYDFYHFASTPEWAELGASISREDLGDDYFPDFWHGPTSSQACPPWAASGPQLSVVAYLHLLAAGDPAADRAWSSLQYLRFKASRVKNTTPQGACLSQDALEAELAGRDLPSAVTDGFRYARRGDDLLAAFRDAVAQTYDRQIADSLIPPFTKAYLDAFAGRDAVFDADLAAARANGDAQGLLFEFDPRPPPLPQDAAPGSSPEDVAVFASVVPGWASLFQLYDAVILYGQTPLLGHLAGIPYLAYEHGTIRHLPFEDHVVGRLTRDAYQAGHGVFLTNMDYVTAERRIDIRPDRRIYIPHGFDERPLLAFANRHRREPAVAAQPVRFLAPARHLWATDKTGESKGNDQVVRAVARLVAEGRTGFVVQAVGWGQDLEATRALIRELGVEAYYEWLEPMPQASLWRAYMDSDAVLDQFVIPAIGAVACEALALGRRVITRPNPQAELAFFEERIPMLGAASPEEIAEAMARVLDDPLDAAGLGDAAQSWTTRRQSAGRIRQILQTAVETLPSPNGG